MALNSRSKGKRGERELFDLLGFGERNLDQTRSGGADGVDTAPFSIEVKRQEKVRLSAWWTQTERQAEAGEDSIPVLAWRRNRQDWNFLVGMTLEEFKAFARLKRDG